MSVYARGAGDHQAERVQPEPGSEEEARLQALADDPASGWRRLDDPEPAEESEPSRPAKSAAKGAWVEWAVSQGADRAEAEKATKDDLIAAYGAESGGGEGDDPNGGGE
ncbi:hypothetical protein ACIBI3_02340 [Actinomadura luteofluorescens]|uniref:hypothetical protein n=1 Tax=Actinomadura luteofluorescens TaxID=46163 RepID=UPI0034814BA7